jgi:hypothetical protein
MIKKFFLVFCLIPCLLITNIYATECILTIPKSGTNLLIKCVTLITNKKNTRHIPRNFSQSNISFEQEILWGHFWLTDETPTIGPSSEKIRLCQKHHLKILLLIRDPRDLICAICRMCFSDINPDNLKAIIERPGQYINKVIGTHSHARQYNTFTKLYSDYLQWAEFENAYVAHFENLVGPLGNGTLEKQIQEVMNIAIFLNNPLTQEEAKEISNQLFGGTPTFRKGQSRTWKKYWTSDLEKLFFEKEGNLLVELGYE